MRFIRFAFYSFLVLAALAYMGYTKWGKSHTPDIDISYGSGSILTETNITEFDGVEIHGAFEVILSEGNSSKYTIETSEEMHQKVHTHVNNGILTFSTKKWPRKYDKVKLHITAPDYRLISVSGTAKVETDGSILGENLDIRMSGASDADLSLDASRLNIFNSGASDLQLVGSAEDLKINISGAGEIDAEELYTQSTRIDISGAGHAAVHAEEVLHVRVSGAGSVKYHGNPEVTKQISGVGSIRKAN